MLLPTLAAALLAATPVPEETRAAFDAFVTAWNAHDLDAALARFDDDAALTYVREPGPSTASKVLADVESRGKEEIRAFLEDSLDGFHADVLEPKVEVDRVSAKARVRAEGYTRLGLDGVDARFEARVRAGRVVSLVFSLTPEASARIMALAPAANKALIRRLTERLNRKDFSVVDDLISVRYIQHTIMPAGPGRKGLKDFYRAFTAAFPDFEYTIDDMVAEGDRVCVRMTGRYTQRGEFMGIPPTGKPVTVAKMDTFRIVNGRVVEHWDSVDRLGLLQQLGVVPKLPEWTSSPGFEGFR